MTLDECKAGMRVEYIAQGTGRVERGTISKVYWGRVWLRLDRSPHDSRGVYFEREELHRLTNIDDGKAGAK